MRVVRIFTSAVATATVIGVCLPSRRRRSRRSSPAHVQHHDPAGSQSGPVGDEADKGHLGIVAFVSKAHVYGARGSAVGRQGWEEAVFDRPCTESDRSARP